MKKAFKYILVLGLSFFTSFGVVAQDLPLIPKDPSVAAGTLPNGISYYLVANPATTGMADFALVQKTGTSDVGDKAYEVAQASLTSLPRFLKESPQSFLISSGVAPGEDGFVKVSDKSTLYNFENVILRNEVVDSLLLFMMDVVDRGTSVNDPLRNWYAPSDHAVVISGDIDVSSMSSKLQMLSYMVPSWPSCPREEYSWKQSDKPEFKVSGVAGKYAAVSATWSSPRTPKEYMNTVQPAIYSMFVNELGLLAKERIAQRLRNDAIPAASVSYEHICSLATSGSEKLTITVCTAPEYLAQAVEVLASTMSALDRRTASAHELDMVKRRYFLELDKQIRKDGRSNSENVDACVAAFLSGATVPSSKEVYKFLKYRKPDAETELKHFNDIASALLDDNRNLSVNCLYDKTMDVSADRLKTLFQQAWNSEIPPFTCMESLDSLPLNASAYPVKLKSTKTDPISGGVQWTFSNGFKVVYKRQDTGRRLYYALALNGGYGNIRGLSKDEGAYASDYLRLSRVAGVDSRLFMLELEENDISLVPSLYVSNTIIEGEAPEAEVEKVIKVLDAFVNTREYDPEAFEYYKSSLKAQHELRKGSVMDRAEAIDSLMYPGYGYSSFKRSGNISEDFPSKVEAFWGHQSRKTNDGVLILVGNMEETRLRKILQNQLGRFVTTAKVYSRVNMNYQPLSGAIAYTLRGDKTSVDMVISSRMSLTSENYMATQIAASIMKQLIADAISGTGMYVKVAHDFRMYPQERFNMMITLEPADPKGFAADSQLTGHEAALAALRRLINSLPDVEIDEKSLEGQKVALKGELKSKMLDPVYWTKAIAGRHLDGKDFTSSFEAKVDAVTAEKVKAILASLPSASRVEYIIEK